jgi:hypothetical protein
MSSQSKPLGLIGHIGMIALRSDAEGEASGQLYVLREPAGMLTTLVGSEVPLSAWHARALASPTTGTTSPPRDIYIADRCLVPVSQMSELELEALISTQDQREFDAAVAETQESMVDSESSEAEMDAMIERAARQFFIGFSLRVAAVPVTLREIGFPHAKESGRSLVWLLEDAGLTLLLKASPDREGQWRLATDFPGRAGAIPAVILLPAEAPRGRVVASLLSLWRAAFPSAAMPDILEMGDLYNRHQSEMGLLLAALPTDPGA